jgi:gp16 family phage-associated protein
MTDKHAEVKDRFLAEGVSIAEWARAHGFSRALVYRVLKGQSACSRGQAHRIAVALGLKKEPLNLRLRSDAA